MALNGGLISVSELNKDSGECSINVRVLHFWFSTDRNGIKKEVEMILLDKEGSKIQAWMNQKLVGKNEKHLNDGQLKTIRNFQVEDNVTFHKAKINHAYKLVVGFKTRITNCNDDIYIPTHGFQFRAFSDILHEMLDTKFALDVIGEVSGVKEIEIVQARNNARKMDLTLTDSRGVTITCVLWEEHADELKQFIQSKNDGHIEDEPIVLAVQFGAISKYQETNRVTTMKHMSRIFINPNIPNDEMNITSIDIGDQSTSLTLARVPSEWLNPSCARTLKDLLHCSVPGVYTTFVKMSDVDIISDWYYKSCGKCIKQVDSGAQVGDSCRHCNQVIEAIIPRFKIKIVVKHENAEAYILLWEDAAVEILGMSAVDILATLSHKDGIPDDFDKFLDLECLLKLKVPHNKHKEFSVKSITRDKQLVSQFQTMINTNEVASQLDGTNEKNHELKDKTQEVVAETIDESASNSIGVSVTPQKRSLQNVEVVDGPKFGDAQLSATKSIKLEK